MSVVEVRSSAAPAVDDGYFPRGRSVLREVQEQRMVGLFYGQRALAIGAIAPLNFVGTMAHTRARGKPFQRLAHTGKVFETIFFGTGTEADRALEFVHGQHVGVKGELPEDAGATAAGTPYSALDPELMLWTMAVMADSALHFYELFVRALSPEERESYWQDYIRFGELFGMPRAVAPPTWAEFRDWYEGRIAGPEAHLSDDARFVGSAIMFEIPTPAAHRPAMRVHNLIQLGALHPRVREMYGLRYTRSQAAAFRAVVAGVRAQRPITPRRIRSGENTYFFDAVAHSERALIRRGAPVPGALP